MRAHHPLVFTIFLASSLLYFSCKKEVSQSQQQPQQNSVAASNANAENPTFNLEVILRGNNNAFGLVKFRQDVDPQKIITLDTWVRDLEATHSYLLQRAVDPVVDGDCTSNSWLTLGKGLTPQSITTDIAGTGRQQLWRDVSAVPSGSKFDIHFRIVDATTMQVVLTSDCYQYMVR